MTTGQLIRSARKNAGMTQAELAHKLGISYVGVSQWENDLRNPKYETLKRIAAALGVNWTDLVPEEEQGEVATAGIIDKLKHLQEKGATWRKLSEAEAHRMGFIQFKSDEDRIAFFYDRLNTDGKLVASRRMFQSLDPEKVKDVADYMEQLSEIPQYQRHAPTDAPQPPAGDTDTTATETPPTDAPAPADGNPGEADGH